MKSVINDIFDSMMIVKAIVLNKKMKKAIVVFILLAIVATLSGCTLIEHIEERGQEEAARKQEAMFMLYQSFPYGYVWIDRETGVMYWVSDGPHNSGTLTLLVNADGTPKVWDGTLP